MKSIPSNSTMTWQRGVLCHPWENFQKKIHNRTNCIHDNMKSLCVMCSHNRWTFRESVWMNVLSGKLDDQRLNASTFLCHTHSLTTQCVSATALCSWEERDRNTTNNTKTNMEITKKGNEGGWITSEASTCIFYANSKNFDDIICSAVGFTQHELI